MNRNIEQQLIRWKNKKRRKPLIVHGARQVGKTYIIKQFGEKYYDNILYLNFEINQKIIKDFEENISPFFYCIDWKYILIRRLIQNIH